MESFKPPCRFNPNADENFVQAWKDWKTEFTFYLIATEKSAVADNVKVGMLLCAMGPQWIKVYTKFDWNAGGDKDKLDCVLEKFDKHIEPKKLLKSYITRFQQRVQTPNETVTDYIQAVRELASHCELGALEESQVCLQISNGVRDPKLKEKLWEDDLTLTQLAKKCNFFDQAAETRKLTTTETHVHAVHTQRGRNQSKGRGQGNDRGQRNDRGYAEKTYQGQGQRPGRSKYRGAYRGAHPPPEGRSDVRLQRQLDCGDCGKSHGPQQSRLPTTVPQMWKNRTLCTRLQSKTSVCMRSILDPGGPVV